MKLIIDVPDMKPEELDGLLEATRHDNALHRADLGWLVPVGNGSRVHRHRIITVSQAETASPEQR